MRLEGEVKAEDRKGWCDDMVGVYEVTLGFHHLQQELICMIQ